MKTRRTRKVNLYKQSDSDDLGDVEIEQQAFREPKYCIDHASPFYIWLLIFVYLGLLLFYGLTGVAAPSKLSEATKSVPTPRKANGTSVPVDLRIVDLYDSDFMFELNCTAVRGVTRQSTENQTIGAMITKSHRHIKNFQDVYVSEETRSSEALVFKAGEMESQPIRIHPVQVNGFDSIALSLSFKFNNSHIDSLIFHYRYVDPAGPRFLQITRYIMSAIIAYGLVVFLIGNIWKISTSLPSILGILGILASHPLEFLMPNWFNMNGLTSIILLYVFINYFRFFLLKMLTACIKNTGVLFMTRLALAVGCAVMVVIDVFSTEVHNATIMKYASSQNDHSLSNIEYLQVVSTSVYGIISLGLACFCLFDMMNVGGCSIRHTTFVIVSLTTTMASVLDKILNISGRAQFQTLPDMMIDASHFLGAAICLILLKPIAAKDIDQYRERGEFLLRSHAFI